MKVRALLASVGAALALGLFSPAWAGYELSVVPSATSGIVGDTIDVAINLSLGTGDDNVDSMDFSLTFDPAVLRYQVGSGMAGAVTDGWFDFRIEESPSGSINISALDLDGAPPPGGSVAEFQFTLINVGSTDLKLVGLGGVGDITLTVPSSFDAFAPDPVTNSSITVQASTQIPNPASLLLVGLALALLGWTRRNAGARSVG